MIRQETCRQNKSSLGGSSKKNQNPGFSLTENGEGGGQPMSENFCEKFQVNFCMPNTGFFLTLSENSGGVNPCQKTFAKKPKLFFACQIHPKMLKHVLQRWESDI